MQALNSGLSLMAEEKGLWEFKQQNESTSYSLNNQKKMFKAEDNTFKIISTLLYATLSSTTPANKMMSWNTYCKLRVIVRRC